MTRGDYEKIRNYITFTAILCLFFINVNAAPQNSNASSFGYDLNEVMDYTAYNYYNNLGTTSLTRISQNSIISPLSICIDGRCEIANWSITGITQKYQDSGAYKNNNMLYKDDYGVTKICGTIAAKGCALTSFAMYLSKLGQSKTPGEVNTALGTSACSFNADTAASKFNIHAQVVYTNNGTNGLKFDGYLPTIIGIIQSGKPAMIGLYDWTSKKSHFVLATGYILYDIGSFDFIKIMNTGITSIYLKLNDYTENPSTNWYVTRIYTFNN